MRWLILLTVSLVGCSKSPKLEPVDGGWFGVSLPQGWSECKAEAPFALCRSIKDTVNHRDVAVRVSAPMLLQDGAVSAFLESQVRGVAGSSAMTTHTPDPTFVSGHPAFVAPVDGQREDGIDTSYRLWALERNGFGILIMCGATGVEAARAAPVCDDIIKSFVLISPLEPTTVVRVAPRQLGPLSMNVPKAWIDATKDPAAKGLLAGARAQVAEEGVIAAMLVSSSAETDLAAFAASFEPPEGAKKLSQRSQNLKLGQALVAQFEMGPAHAFVYHVLSGGTGYRLWCLFPKKTADVYATICDSMAASATLLPQ